MVHSVKATCTTSAGRTQMDGALPDLAGGQRRLLLFEAVEAAARAAEGGGVVAGADFAGVDGRRGERRAQQTPLLLR